MILIPILIIIILVVVLYFKNKEKIPNIIHFVFGLKPQEEEFCFVYYLSVLSAYIVNRPKIIYFYYHYEPYGKWWERLKEKIKVLKLEKILLPTHIGKKKIIHFAHKADWVRMNKLYEKGGIYMDIDTITFKPYKDLLKYNTVLGYEIKSKDLICNAFMMTIPKSDFFTIWLKDYEKNFIPDGWGEASIHLPGKINKKYPFYANVLTPEYFFRPYATEGDKIFQKDVDIDKNLITLHLWETYTKKYIDDIKNYDWIENNKHTLFSKIVTANISKDDI